MRRAQNRRDAAGVVENVFEVREAVILLRAVMMGIGAAVGRFDAERVRQIVTGYKIIE